MNQLVLFGAYGFENVGDKLLADYYRSLVYSAFPEYPRHIVTAGRIAPLFPGESIVSRWQVWPLITKASSDDLWIAGGGSLLQNRTSCRSLFFYTSLIELVALRGAPVVMLGQGYGPIHGKVWMKAASHALSRTHLIECRDALTYHQLEMLPVKNVPIQKGVDPSWGLTLPEQKSKGDGLLLIVKRADAERIPKILTALSSTHFSGMIKVIALDKTDEAPLRRACGDRYFGTARDVDSFISFAEGTYGVLSSRLHGIILGALAGLSAIGLGDDPKVIGICQELGFTMNALVSYEDYEALPNMVSEMSFSLRTMERINTLQEQARKARRSVEATLRELGDGNGCGLTS